MSLVGHDGLHDKGLAMWNDEGVCAWYEGELATIEEWMALVEKAGAKPAGE